MRIDNDERTVFPAIPADISRAQRCLSCEARHQLQPLVLPQPSQT
jgi:hypothetical protein